MTDKKWVLIERELVGLVMKEEADKDGQEHAKERDKLGMIVVKPGRGSFKRAVSEAGARAIEDPESLMKSLGVVKPVDGKDDIVRAVQVISRAISSNDVMADAYKKSKEVSAEEGTVGVITMGELDVRNGARFVAHALEAAHKSKLLHLDKRVFVKIDRTRNLVVLSSVPGE